MPSNIFKNAAIFFLLYWGLGSRHLHRSICHRQMALFFFTFKRGLNNFKVSNELKMATFISCQNVTNTIFFLIVSCVCKDVVRLEIFLSARIAYCLVFSTVLFNINVQLYRADHMCYSISVIPLDSRCDNVCGFDIFTLFHINLSFRHKL